MKSIKQILSEANYMIKLSEQSPSDINADLQARLKAAEERLLTLKTDPKGNWLDDTRADEIRALVHQELQDADARTIAPPLFDFDMNNGLGNLPDMDLGFNLDLNIPEDEPVQNDGWGFGKSDPYYFNLDTPRW